jgi:hypothetical protein
MLGKTGTMRGSLGGFLILPVPGRGTAYGEAGEICVPTRRTIVFPDLIRDPAFPLSAAVQASSKGSGIADQVRDDEDFQ